MIGDNCVGKDLQSLQNKCMIKPTSEDLIFDFSSITPSICMNCSNLKRCQVAFLLNVAVKECAYFQEGPSLFGKSLGNSNANLESLSL